MAENALGTSFLGTKDLGPCVREREVPRVSLVGWWISSHIIKHAEFDSWVKAVRK